jgi:predicted alpha-1,2-mannosidase
MIMRMRFLAWIFLLNAAVQLHSQDLVRYVNPFVGTLNGGNTFPGAVRPWGMVSVSPHNNLSSPSGYTYRSKSFYGFGHVHLSGTGCADLGSIVLTASRGPVRTQPEGYKCTMQRETAVPGFYSVHLQEPGVLAEATSTLRCGVTQFTSLREGDVTFLIDAGRSLGLVGGGAVTILSNAEVEGFNTSGGFCGEANRQRTYFVARFSESADSSGVWLGNRVTRGSQCIALDSLVGCWFSFHTRRGDSILVRIGISYVSTANARQNLNAEVADRGLESIKAEARGDWQQELGRIRVQEGPHNNLVTFYTALYHTLIHPNIISDFNGDYPLMGRRGTGRYADRDRYSVFSLWDTYRTLHPFLCLVYPDRQSAMVRTMIDMYTESGWLPKWELAGNETYMMVGDPASIVIADSYTRGITDFDVMTAFEAMSKPAAVATQDTSPSLRPGYHEFVKYGYIPFEQDTTKPWWVWGPVSTTLEYCLADWALGHLGEQIGRSADAEKFIQRSSNYRNLFEPLSGFMRPRLGRGDWLEPFNPEQTEGSGNWGGSGGPGYVEGNAWHYTWFVPHDVQGLVALFGGAELFGRKLIKCFEENHFTITNEPDIGYPYLFTYLPGQERYAAKIIRNVMNHEFGPGPGGLPGNDDAGAISAWYVFSALGFYPACPASEEYRLGIPAFDKVTIRLDDRYYTGKEFVVETRGEATDEPFVKSKTLNGKRLERYSLRHREIVSGGSLIFNLSK